MRLKDVLMTVFAKARPKTDAERAWEKASAELREALADMRESTRELSAVTEQHRKLSHEMLDLLRKDIHD